MNTQQQFAIPQTWNKDFDPHLLCSNLMTDLRGVVNLYDIYYPKDQSLRSRYFLFAMHELLRNVENELQEEKDTEDKASFQIIYDALITEIVRNVNDYLEEKSKLLNFLQCFFRKYHIQIPSVTFVSEFAFEQRELNALFDYERNAYNQALRSLQQTIQTIPTALPELQDVKEKSTTLVNLIESSRQKYDTNASCWQPAFDFRRQTVNLKKTRELLEDPLNQTKMNEYHQLTAKNYDNSAIVYAMCTLVGALTTAVFALFTLVNPLAYIGVGACALYTATSCTAFSHALLSPNTYKKMNEVEEAVVKHNRVG